MGCATRDDVEDVARGLVGMAAECAAPDQVLLVLSTLGARSLLRLDARLRNWRWQVTDAQRQHIDEAALAGVDPLALLLTACSGDGHLRQRAVATPLMHRDRRLLPVLLIRTSDWVSQVRDEAIRAVAAALEATDTDALLRAAGVAMAMRDWYRGDHAVTAVTEALRARSDATLDKARHSGDVQVRRLAYRLWLESGDASPDALAVAALTERDIICQRLPVDAIVRDAVRRRQRASLERLLDARFARVRVEALYATSDLRGWLEHDAGSTYDVPAPSTRDRLGGLIDAAEADLGTASARLLRFHLGLPH